MRSIDALFSQSNQLELDTKCLQKDDTTIVDGRLPFDGSIAKLPKMDSQISTGAVIVEDLNFEKAIVKLQSGIGSATTAAGRTALQKTYKTILVRWGRVLILG